MFTEKRKYSCRKNIIRILKFIITFFYFIIKNHLHFNYIFSYDENIERTHKAQIIFEQVDIDDVRVLVFNNRWLDDFQGQCINLETYQSKYKNSEFEVIDETYNWGKAMFQGWLRTEDVPVHCIMDIRFNGKMIYVIED